MINYRIDDIMMFYVHYTTGNRTKKILWRPISEGPFRTSLITPRIKDIEYIKYTPTFKKTWGKYKFTDIYFCNGRSKTKRPTFKAKILGVKLVNNLDIAYPETGGKVIITTPHLAIKFDTPYDLCKIYLLLQKHPPTNWLYHK